MAQPKPIFVNPGLNSPRVFTDISEVLRQRNEHVKQQILATVAKFDNQDVNTTISLSMERYFLSTTMDIARCLMPSVINKVSPQYVPAKVAAKLMPGPRGETRARSQSENRAGPSNNVESNIETAPKKAVLNVTFNGENRKNAQEVPTVQNENANPNCGKQDGQNGNETGDKGVPPNEVNGDATAKAGEEPPEEESVDFGQYGIFKTTTPMLIPHPGWVCTWTECAFHSLYYAVIIAHVRNHFNITGTVNHKEQEFIKIGSAPVPVPKVPSLPVIHIETQEEVPEDMRTTRLAAKRLKGRILNSRMSSRLKSKSKLRSSKPKLNCPDCGRTFKSRVHLASHQNIHRGVEPFLCSWPDCGFRSAFRNGTTAHIRYKHLMANKGKGHQANAAKVNSYLKIVTEEPIQTQPNGEAPINNEESGPGPSTSIMEPVAGPSTAITEPIAGPSSSIMEQVAGPSRGISILEPITGHSTEMVFE